MSLKQLTKANLLELASDLSIDNRGTKAVLEDRIGDHLDNHPELESDEKFKKYISFRKRASPRKLFGSLTDAVPSSPSSRTLKPLNAKLNSSPEKSRVEDDIVNISEDEDEDEDEDEENDEVEIEVELVEREDGADEGENFSITTGKDSELLDDNEIEQEEADIDYIPHYPWITKVQDYVIEKYEDFNEYVADKSDETYDSFFTKSHKLRKQLSTADSINYLTNAIELGLILYQTVPLIELGNAPFFDQDILEKYFGNYIKSSWLIVDFRALIQFKFLFTLFTWFTLSYILPSIGSYYFNFIAKKSKKHAFDPLTFALFKLLLAHVFLTGNVSFNNVANDAQVWAEEHGLLENASYLTHLQAHLFHSSITLRLILGQIPFIHGFIGVLVSLYTAIIGK
ncbi:hypothetical protein WICMUC_003560 [Wickerhamomyces mucosus]|uniref:SAP domain-containing protein n=1 Tax=Wickerhamomyces mucosus TaxID=1378264 RepID=A0A9P8PKR9_9ASCO|nr:hypothetical protein WICMUC_003560 [Wickerhamomyces mucosus]